jgi:hypothetical protein
LSAPLEKSLVQKVAQFHEPVVSRHPRNLTRVGTCIVDPSNPQSDAVVILPSRLSLPQLIHHAADRSAAKSAAAPTSTHKFLLRSITGQRYQERRLALPQHQFQQVPMAVTQSWRGPIPSHTTDLIVETNCHHCHYNSMSRPHHCWRCSTACPWAIQEQQSTSRLCMGEFS